MAVKMTWQQASRVAAEAAELAAAKALEGVIVVDSEAGFEVVPIGKDSKLTQQVETLAHDSKLTQQVETLAQEVETLKKQVIEAGFEVDPAIEISYPDGIHDMGMWGRTIIAWGNTVKGRTYENVATSEKEADKNYIRWVGKGRKGHAAMRDFVNYLTARGSIADADATFIPGTDQVRRLADQP